MSDFIDEQIARLKQKHNDPAYVAPNLQDNIPQDNSFTDNGSWLEAAGIGASNMLNNLVLGGSGQVLGSIGDIVERFSPFSGSRANDRYRLIAAGLHPEIAQQLSPDQDSWLTALGKYALQAHNSIDDSIRDWRNNAIGDNPSYGTQVAEGVGSSLGFMGAGLTGTALSGGNVLTGAILSGLTEALSESGGTAADAYRQGLYDNGGLAAANKSFAVNALLNAGLNAGAGMFSPWMSRIRNPITRYATQTAGEVLNELIQEPSQQTIEKSAQQSLYNGGNFVTALGQNIPDWWDTAKQLAPTVAASSAITSLLKGGLDMTSAKDRQQVKDQWIYRNKDIDVDNTDAKIKAHFDAVEALKKRLQREKSGKNNPQTIDSLERRIDKRLHQIERLKNIRRPLANSEYVYTPDDEISDSYTANISLNDSQHANTRYKLVELDSLIMHDKPNRNKPEYLDNIHNIANNLEPSRLGESTSSSEGAPVIAPDSSVEDGYARLDALRQVYTSDPQKANSYRNWLTENAQSFGYNPAEIQHMKQPVLVRQRISDIQNIAKPSTTSDTQQSNEQASDNFPRKTRNRRRNKITQNDSAVLVPDTEADAENNSENQVIQTPTDNTSPIIAPKSNTANVPAQANVPSQKPNPARKNNTVKIPVETVKRPEGKKVEFINKKEIDTTQNNIDPQRPTGKKTKIVTSRNTEVEIQYRVLEADELIPSNFEQNGKVNPLYPAELQPRDRTKDLDGQIGDIAHHPDPERLAENRMASDGAPVIGSDRVVESGNGRVMGLTRSYRLGKADAYKQFLVDNAERFGLHPDDISAMQSPILVRERLTDVNRQQFTSEANEASIASMGNTENAYDDARGITPNMLKQLDFSKPIDENIPFVSSFTGTLSRNEKNMMVDKHGRPSRYAYERANYALAAKAYGDESIIARLSETQNDDLKNLSKGLLDAALPLAVLQDGSFRENLSLQNDIAEAVDWLQHIRKEGLSVSEFLAAPNLDFLHLSDNVETLLRFFDNHKRSPNDITQAFINYVQIAQNEAKNGQASMFDDSVRSKEDILTEALRKVDAEKEGGTVAQSSFKNWFGDWQKNPKKASKVVDEKGSPLIVFHGTNSENEAAPFSEFDTNGGHDLTRNTGAWFTSNRKAAKTFGNYVYEVYLNIRNPFIYESNNGLEDISMREQIARDVRAGKYNIEGEPEYDGVIFRNVEDDSNDDLVSDVFVIFEKNQVKSADLNNGNFDTVNANVFRQDGSQDDNVQNIPTNDQKQEQEISDDEDSQSNSDEYDGFIGYLDVNEHNGDTHSTNIFFDEDNGRPYLDITDDNGDSVATYDMRSDTFSIRPEHKTTGWVRNVEDDFRRQFGKNPTEEILRRSFRQQAIDAGASEQNADASATAYIAGNKFFAKYSGQSLFDTVRSDNLSIRKGIHQENDNSRGSTTFIEQAKDEAGNVIKEAQTIVKLFQNANKSTLLHEIGHIFLEKLKNLARANMLNDKKGKLNKAGIDWGILMRHYGLKDIDFSKSLSGKDLELWHNAQENFAASLEKYFYKGNTHDGVSKKLKHIFEAFKGWLKDIYSALTNIKYTDTKGVKHAFSLSKDVKAVFDDFFADRNNTPRAIIDNGILSSYQPNNNNKRDISFPTQEIERRFVEASKPPSKMGTLARVKHAFLSGIKNIAAGDYADIARSQDPNVRKARNLFRQLERDKKSVLAQAMKTFSDNLNGLDNEQLDLFNRARVIQDLMFRIEKVPGADLPFGLTHQQVRDMHKKLMPHVENDEAVKNAIQKEEQTIQSINQDFINAARLLGYDMSGVFSNPHYYRHRIIDYMDAVRAGRRIDTSTGNINVQDTADSMLREAFGRGYLKRYKGSTMDFVTDYVQANSEVRVQMLQDIETLKTLYKLKQEYDIAPRLKKQFGKQQDSQQLRIDDGSQSFSQSGDSEIAEWLAHVPEGMTALDPTIIGLTESDKSVKENILDNAIREFSQKNGIPIDRLLEQGLTVENNIMVIPNEIAETLRKMAKSKHRGALGQAAKKLTTWWKQSVLFTPTRNLLYNIRNFTGDLDAVIAGNPHSLKHLPRAVKELTVWYTQHGKEGYEASQDLQDYIRLSGTLGIQSLNLTRADAQAILDLIPTPEKTKSGKTFPKRADKEAARLERAEARMQEAQNSQQDEEPGKLRKAAGIPFEAIRKFFKTEHDFTEWREHLLRFATYLDYKQQMESNKNGRPNNWGASIEEEVMSISDIKERAFKMSNELLGAYDQVSEMGRQLRDFLIPFYSWMEVNMRRTWRLLKNGFKYGYGARQAKQLALGKAASMPFYALSAAESVTKLMLLTGAMQMFNRFVFPDADDDLPNDVKYRPHVTVGEINGRVYYFDRLGAIADVLDWFSLDSAWLDAKDFANGQQTLGGYLQKMIKAPFSKIINGLNPAIKMPIELAMGRSMFPDAFNPSTIRDPAEYVARSFGMVWPYRVATGKPHDNLQELSKMFIYSQDADEAAYWQTLDRVRQFQNQVLDKHFDGFASTRRGRILQNIKKALRYKDGEAVRRFIREFHQADGTKQGLKQSMKAMDPLHGLSEKEKAQFLKWISPDDRKYLRKAQRYFHQLADRFLR